MTTDSVLPFEGFACNGSESDVTISVGSLSCGSPELRSAFLKCRRTVLVESFLFAVYPTDAGVSFEVFRHSSSPLKLRTIPVASLPCSSVPLQSPPSQLVIENHAVPNRVEYTMAPNTKRIGSASSIRRANAYHLSNSSVVPVTSTGSIRVGRRDFRQHLPWGLGPFGGNGPSDVVLAYHPSTIRSQSFSLSQRFSPLELCGSISHHIHP